MTYDVETARMARARGEVVDIHRELSSDYRVMTSSVEALLEGSWQGDQGGDHRREQRLHRGSEHQWLSGPACASPPSTSATPPGSPSPAGGVDNPAPADLGLPGDLASDLDRWSDDFDAISPPADPGAAAFASPEEEQAFYDRGLRLARRVADAVGDRYEVTYRGRISDTETSLS